MRAEVSSGRSVFDSSSPTKLDTPGSAVLAAVSIAAELPAHQVLARANAEKVQRVLFNLIQNAIRHTPADGSVVVRAEPVAGRIEIEIADTGEGTDEVQQMVIARQLGC